MTGQVKAMWMEEQEMALEQQGPLRTKIRNVWHFKGQIYCNVFATDQLFRLIGRRFDDVAAQRMVNKIELKRDVDLFHWEEVQRRPQDKPAAPTRDELIAEGKRTGICQVCNRKLTNPDSVAAGIGPICAGRI